MLAGHISIVTLINPFMAKCKKKKKKKKKKKTKNNLSSFYKGRPILRFLNLRSSIGKLYNPIAGNNNKLVISNRVFGVKF